MSVGKRLINIIPAYYEHQRLVSQVFVCTTNVIRMEKLVLDVMNFWRATLKP